MRRSTVILLVLFALLGALTWYMQQPTNVIKQALATSTSLPAATNETLVDLNGGSVSRIQVTDASGKSVTLDNSGNAWTINQDKDGPTDQQLADAATSHVYSLQIITRLEKAPDPVGTGLDKPAYELNISQGTRIDNFKIGKLTATASGYYVQTADGSVTIVSKSAIEAMLGLLINPPFPATATPAASETPSAGSNAYP